MVSRGPRRFSSAEPRYSSRSSSVLAIFSMWSSSSTSLVVDAISAVKVGYSAVMNGWFLMARTDEERLLYLGSALENLRGTFFRQAMFADFERDVHAKVDKGESLTGEALTAIYGNILKRYHGDAQGVVKIDDAYSIEWAYIPHFYNRFYVFQYATSISAGNMFADEILKGTPGARERYLDILRAGGSRYPYELVKAAGVDLASPAPYQAIVARMNRIMDDIEVIVAKRK